MREMRGSEKVEVTEEGKEGKAKGSDGKKGKEETQHQLEMKLPTFSSV